jgi:hypothetical protein
VGDSFRKLVSGRWALTVNIPAGFFARFSHWELGVRIAGRVHEVTVGSLF